jgi:DNA-binding MarR family transcriptional regulator
MTVAAPIATEEELARLRSAVMLLNRRLRALSTEEGLTPAQSSALATLVRKGPMRAGDLAAAEAVNPTMLSRILGHLEEAGLAARVADPRDGRATRVEATPAGRRLLGRLRTRRGALLGALLEALPPGQVETLLAALPALEALGGDA